MALERTMLARSSPAGLAWYYSNGAWVMAPHLSLLSQKVVDVAMGRIPRLIVTMPPRHGKSELISRFTPAWYLGTFPDRKVILASYSDQFAASWGRRAREVMEAVGQPLWGLSVNSEAKGGQHWELNPPKGRRVFTPAVMSTAGVGGGITGKGANLMVIDDPVKNAADAQSDVVRKAQWDWWLTTARTRLQPGAGVILVMTRWHEDDLAGRFLSSTDEHWEILNFPAVCEVDGPDDLGRSKGDALWPEMYDTENLKATKAAMGNYWFGAMYQQSPTPAEGNMFKREHLRYYSRNPDGTVLLHRDGGDFHFDIGYGSVVQTVDVAGSSKEDADFTVVSTWAITPEKDLVWLDMEEVRFESLDVGGFVRRKFMEYKPLLLGVERLGFGLTVIQELLRDGLPITRLEPNLDKVARALSAVARTEEHRVYLPKDAVWRDRVVGQLVGFPNTTNDDIVDTLSYAALMLPNVAPAAVARRMGGQQKAQTWLGNVMGRVL